MQADSQTHSLSLPFFNTGTPEEWLKCHKNIKKVITGQNTTTGPQKFTVARRVLTGDALATLETSLGDKNPTLANFTAAVNAVVQHMFPLRAPVSQK